MVSSSSHTTTTSTTLSHPITYLQQRYTYLVAILLIILISIAIIADTTYVIAEHDTITTTATSITTDEIPIVTTTSTSTTPETITTTTKTSTCGSSDHNQDSECETTSRSTSTSTAKKTKSGKKTRTSSSSSSSSSASMPSLTSTHDKTSTSTSTNWNWWLTLSASITAGVVGLAAVAYWWMRSAAAANRLATKQASTWSSHLLVETHPTRPRPNQGSNWVWHKLRVDAEGDVAHEHLGPFARKPIATNNITTTPTTSTSTSTSTSIRPPAPLIRTISIHTATGETSAPLISTRFEDIEMGMGTGIGMELKVTPARVINPNFKWFPVDGEKEEKGKSGTTTSIRASKKGSVGKKKARKR